MAQQISYLAPPLNDREKINRVRNVLDSRVHRTDSVLDGGYDLGAVNLRVCPRRFTLEKFGVRKSLNGSAKIEIDVVEQLDIEANVLKIGRLKHREIEQLLARRAGYDCLKPLHSRCSMFGR